MLSLQGRGNGWLPRQLASSAGLVTAGSFARDTPRRRARRAWGPLLGRGAAGWVWVSHISPSLKIVVMMSNEPMHKECWEDCDFNPSLEFLVVFFAGFRFRSEATIISPNPLSIPEVVIQSINN